MRSQADRLVPAVPFKDNGAFFAPAGLAEGKTCCRTAIWRPTTHVPPSWRPQTSSPGCTADLHSRLRESGRRHRRLGRARIHLGLGQMRAAPLA